MNITTRIFSSVEELFNVFEYDISAWNIKSATCIAHSDAGGGDEIESVYELYIDGHPRFFAVAISDQYQDPSDELTFIKKWSESKDATLISHAENEHYTYASLYELREPLGIRFEQ